MAGITLSFRRLKSWRNELGGAVKGSAPIIAARAIARSRVFQKGRPFFHVVSDVQSLDHRVECGGCRPDSSPAFRRKATPPGVRSASPRTEYTTFIVSGGRRRPISNKTWQNRSGREMNPTTAGRK